MWKRISLFIISTILVLMMAGCGDGLSGETIYCVSPFDGEVTTVVFNKDGSWHASNGKNETTGDWHMEDDNVVLTSSSGWTTVTLTPAGDGVWRERNGEEWELYYPSEEQAREAADEMIASAPERARAVLEGNEWTLVTTWNMNIETPATISFIDGQAAYTAPEYAAPSAGLEDGDWRGIDHSGAYTLGIEEIGDGWGRYAGTIEIGGESVRFALNISSNGYASFTL